MANVALLLMDARDHCIVHTFQVIAAQRAGCGASGWQGVGHRAPKGGVRWPTPCHPLALFGL